MNTGHRRNPAIQDNDKSVKITLYFLFLSIGEYKNLSTTLMKNLVFEEKLKTVLIQFKGNGVKSKQKL